MIAKLFILGVSAFIGSMFIGNHRAEVKRIWWVEYRQTSTRQWFPTGDVAPLSPHGIGPTGVRP